MNARINRPRRFAPAILAGLITVLSVTSLFSPQLASAAVCTNPYTVVSGDSFFAIAIKQGIPKEKRSDYVAQIIWINKNPKVIHPGDVLCLPPKPNTPPPTPNKIYTRAEVESIIRQIWPDLTENIALAIVERESHLNPYSLSSGKYYGLFQVSYSVHKLSVKSLYNFLGGQGDPSPNVLFDPTFNTLWALTKYRAGGWGPWCSSSGFPVFC